MNKISNFGVFTLLFISSLTIMVGTVIAPSLSGIVKQLDFGFSPSWLITLPSLGVVVFAPIIGRLINKLGSLKLLILGLVPYAILGVIGAFISNDYLLILDRFLLGAATVAIQVSVTLYIAAFFTGEERMKMIAWQGMAIELGGVIFLAIGGILGQMHWQFPFYIYLLALVCLMFVLKALPKPDAKRKEKGVFSKNKNESKFKVQLIFYASLLAMMLFFVGFVSLPLYLPETFGFSESQTGYLMAFISVIAIITASQMPKVVKYTGDVKTVVFGFLFFMLGYMVLAIAGNVPVLVLAVICIGVGFGFTIPLLNHMMIEASSLQNQGKNLGLYSMGVFGGQFLSTFIEYISNNYMVVYSVSAVMAFVIGSVILWLFQRLGKN
ncbi:MFS transporter [Cyclobacterium marinum]|uniref:Major facilitator superfamily MFS_1 n=1 Tax=Cyclobacterium marinum (strain ATCC 25205 / DSM 745 / LMG 13164 / NCIMB 1802) TaxID=880070 RepID=G0J2A1_CYCMS|nr:MFS transporter [Cyclobacterium marinum]AEL25175.1 major facilitator superfamily MFS_1 [Cyclobacterium marinum DSM 745]